MEAILGLLGLFVVLGCYINLLFNDYVKDIIKSKIRAYKKYSYSRFDYKSVVYFFITLFFIIVVLTISLL